MPRTKVAKNAKRNREAAHREEKIRVYEMKMDVFALNLEELGHTYMTQIDNMLQKIITSNNSLILQMKMGEFIELDLQKLSDYKASDQTMSIIGSQSVCNSTILKDVNRNDEGYLTEDSPNSRGSVASSIAYTSSGSTLGVAGSKLPSIHSAKAARTPGPLHSARARRGRRSRSACSDMPIPSSAKPKSALSTSGTATEHASRNKLRTPVASRSKALSADRTSHAAFRGTSPSTPPMAFLRWPKPGEIALSKCGSPIVAQVMPDHVANVNIPIRNGVLSLRPKKLNELNQDFIDAIDSDTLNQIKTLHANLNMIVNMADKASLK